MNLVEAPDHAGPAAPPHAPERLRTLLAEGRDAQNDETAQSEKGKPSKKNSTLKLIRYLRYPWYSHSESKNSNILPLGGTL